MNLVVPHRAFEIATVLASLGVVSTWVTILVCQPRLRTFARRGQVTGPPGAGCSARRSPSWPG
jgi:L-asparagine permease